MAVVDGCSDSMMILGRPRSAVAAGTVIVVGRVAVSRDPRMSGVETTHVLDDDLASELYVGVTLSAQVARRRGKGRCEVRVADDTELTVIQQRPSKSIIDGQLIYIGVGRGIGIVFEPDELLTFVAQSPVVGVSLSAIIETIHDLTGVDISDISRLELVLTTVSRRRDGPIRDQVENVTSTTTSRILDGPCLDTALVADVSLMLNRRLDLVTTLVTHIDVMV